MKNETVTILNGALIRRLCCWTSVARVPGPITTHVSACAIGKESAIDDFTLVMQAKYHAAVEKCSSCPIIDKTARNNSAYFPRRIYSNSLFLCVEYTCVLVCLVAIENIINRGAFTKTNRIALVQNSEICTVFVTGLWCAESWSIIACLAAHCLVN